MNKLDDYASSSSREILDKFVSKLTEENLSFIENSDKYLDKLDDRYRKSMGDLHSSITYMNDGSIAIYVSPNDDTGHGCKIDLNKMITNTVSEASEKEYSNKVISSLEEIINNIRDLGTYT